MLAFVKVEAAGNDFVLIDALEGRRENWPALAQRLCDRHFGIGADGLLLVQPSSARMAKARGKPLFRMRMFNPDGSEDMCGNGLCCVSAYLYCEGFVRDLSFFIQTLSGACQVVIAVKAWRVFRSVQVNLGPPLLRGAQIPAATDASRVLDYPLNIGGRTVPVTALSTGTPHAVVFSENLSEVEALGPQIMAHPFFPAQASVSLVKVEGENRLVARTWERGGVGESLSCGTGAAAILAAAHLKGLTGREADVIYPGGTLHVRWDCNGDLWLSSPVNDVFEGGIQAGKRK